MTQTSPVPTNVDLIILLIEAYSAANAYSSSLSVTSIPPSHHMPHQKKVQIHNMKSKPQAKQLTPQSQLTVDMYNFASDEDKHELLLRRSELQGWVLWKHLI
jgi:hypothetical protein